jgi:hypothetical protein
MKLSRSEKVDLVSCKTKKRVKVLTPTLAQALGDTAFRWSILLVVWGKESNGKLKTKVDFIKTVAYRHEDLTEYLRREHKALIDSCKAEILDAGWLAVMTPPAFVDDVTEAILVDNLKELLEDKPAQHLISRRDTALNNKKELQMKPKTCPLCKTPESYQDGMCNNKLCVYHFEEQMA